MCLPIQITTVVKYSSSQRSVGFIAAALACFAFLQGALAVVPPPDGGYGNGNTAEGQDALFRLTGGGANTATGFQALFNNTTGSHNTANGYLTLNYNNGDNNTATGYAALYINADGFFNTANGAFALENNTDGCANTAVGGRRWSITRPEARTLQTVFKRSLSTRVGVITQLKERARF